VARPDTVLRVDTPDTAQVQTCYRHTDRRAGVRCQRCGRPICPNCMHQASVGFHCPECVKQSGQRVHTARSVAAAGMAHVTTVLLAVNVATYVFSTFGGSLNRPSSEFTRNWGLVGRAFDGASGALVGVAEGEWYRLVTGGFLHGSLLHLGFNMFALWILGRSLEPNVGRVPYGAVYVASLLAGSLGVMVLDPGALTVGASGAVFGLFGFALVAQWVRGINPMDTGLGGIIILNLIITFTIPGISIGGHLGGLIGGAVAGMLLDVVPPRLGLPRWAGTVLVGLLAVGCFVGSIVAAASLAPG
jgi:membrane associated rhomboid family serine protease